MQNPNRALLKRMFLAAGVALLATTTAGCGAGRLVQAVGQVNTTEDDLQRIGREEHQKLVKAKLVYDDPKLTAYLNRVGQRVAAAAQSSAGGADKSLFFRFFVLDTPEFNAFAAPGGYIYITRGFIALLNTEDELAAVLGHEVAHVTAGHTLKQVNAEGRAGMLGALGTMGLSVVGVLTFNPFLIAAANAGDTANSIATAIVGQSHSRDYEFEADRLSKTYAGLAGYSLSAPTRIISVLQNIAESDAAEAKRKGYQPSPVWGVFASHPTNELRLKAIRAAPAPAGAKPRAAEGDLLQAIDGLAFGIADRIGVQRGNTFYSASHQLVVGLPQSWESEATGDADDVIFLDADSSAYMFLGVQDLPKRQTAEEFAKSYLVDSVFAGKVQRVGQFSGWRGTITPKRRGRGPASLEVMTWIVGDKGYAFVGGRQDSSKLSVSAWLKMFETSVKSLRPLKPEESALAKSIVLRVLPPEPTKGYTYAALAQQNSLGPHTLPTLRLINGQYASKAEPTKSQRVKVLR